jgi:hypothetical protein
VYVHLSVREYNCAWSVCQCLFKVAYICTSFVPLQGCLSTCLGAWVYVPLPGSVLACLSAYWCGGIFLHVYICVFASVPVFQCVCVFFHIVLRRNLYACLHILLHLLCSLFKPLCICMYVSLCVCACLCFNLFTCLSMYLSVGIYEYFTELACLIHLSVYGILHICMSVHVS